MRFEYLGGGRTQKRQRKIYLHSVIAPDCTDHINGNGLDNRKANLRPATRSQNGANSRLSSRSTSGYKGVSYDRARGSWKAQIGFRGENRFLGRYPTAEQAAAAYDAAAQELFGAYARTNQITLGDD